jgi:hypothetical protein
MLCRQANLDRRRTLNPEPSSRWCFDNTDGVIDGLTLVCGRASTDGRWDAYQDTNGS